MAKYTDAWEQRKLGEVAEIVGGGTPSTTVSEYWNGDIDWYSPAEIGSQIYVQNSQKKITELGVQKVQQKFYQLEQYCLPHVLESEIQLF